MSEKHLISDLKESDSPWASWIAQHGHRVLLSLLAFGLPLDKAEEIAQTAWERLITKYGKGLLDTIEMPGLVITQARFLALDYLRREGPKRALESDISDHPQESLALESNPHRALLSKEKASLAMQALATCSLSSQTIFRLFYISDMNAPQIANQLDLSPQRVRQVLCEVRANLRDALETVS